jgi:dipeptidyl aminopeptidase/acylaminoacyl peptidase
MVPTAERRTTTVKADVDDRIPTDVSLAAADEILDYRPLDAAQRLTTPLLVIAVEDDATTPTDHAVALYEAARGPRRLVMQRHTTHYAAYDRYWETVTPLIVDWFDRYVRGGGVVVRSGDGSNDTIEIREDD